MWAKLYRFLMHKMYKNKKSTIERGGMVSGLQSCTCNNLQYLSNKEKSVGFEVLTAVSTKMAVFWAVAPCSLVEVYQRFRGPGCLHHQGDLPDCLALQPRRHHQRAYEESKYPILHLTQYIIHLRKQLFWQCLVQCFNGNKAKHRIIRHRIVIM
jgi:hypothetical protein